MKKLIKNKKLLFGIIGFVIGVSITGVVAYSVYANKVTYDNTQSGLQSTDVQGAIDELYQKAASIPKIYYAFGDPTTSSTTDYTTLNKNVFVALNGTQKSVCIIRNNKLHCFDNNNSAYEKWHIQGVFNDISCNVYSSYVDCSASDFGCTVYSAEISSGRTRVSVPVTSVWITPSVTSICRASPTCTAATETTLCPLSSST